MLSVSNTAGALQFVRRLVVVGAFERSVVVVDAAVLLRGVAAGVAAATALVRCVVAGVAAGARSAGTEHKEGSGRQSIRDVAHKFLQVHESSGGATSSQRCYLRNRSVSDRAETSSYWSFDIMLIMLCTGAQQDGPCRSSSAPGA